MHYLIYKITNKLNGKIYIGQHQTEDPNDGYMGSGTNIKRAIKKYGLENFSRDILYFCTDWDTMNNMEEVLVDEAFIARDDTYNLQTGGKQGFPGEETRRKLSFSHLGKSLSKESIEKRSAKIRGTHRSEETRRKIGEKNRHHRRTIEEKKRLSEAAKKQWESEDFRKRYSEQRKGNFHLSEEHNRKLQSASHSEETNRKRVESIRGKRHYNNGVIEVFSRECPDGFVYGKLKKKVINSRGK